MSTFFGGAEKRMQHRKVILLASALTLSMRSQSKWIKNNRPGIRSGFVLNVFLLPGYGILVRLLVLLYLGILF